MFKNGETRFLKYVWSFFNIMHERVELYSKQTIQFYYFMRACKIVIQNDVDFDLLHAIGFFLYPLKTENYRLFNISRRHRKKTGMK